MSYIIDNPNKWRVSKSGFSIVTGHRDERRIVCGYTGKQNPLDHSAFQGWLENAETICDLYNSNIA